MEHRPCAYSRIKTQIAFDVNEIEEGLVRQFLIDLIRDDPGQKLEVLEEEKNDKEKKEEVDDTNVSDLDIDMEGAITNLRPLHDPDNDLSNNLSDIVAAPGGASIVNSALENQDIMGVPAINPILVQVANSGDFRKDDPNLEHFA